MEINLRLIALGETRKHVADRSVTLNDKMPFVDVGRASSNPQKALEASSNNAMIESPIVSRQHARFHMTKKPGVSVEDLGSTHGTYLSGRKLAKNKSYEVANEEDVTFGCQVVNGPHEHTAKKFRIYFSVKDQQEPQPIPSSSSSRPTIFRVPESESDSDDSRAPSVEIVESKNRFSVPSSDDEDEDSYGSAALDDGMMSLASKQANTSEVTTPESKTSKSAAEHKNSDIEKLLNNDSQQGSSQRNPIEIDKAPVVSYAVLDSESDGEESEEYEPKEPEVEAPKPPSPPVRPQHPLSAILNEQSDHQEPPAASVQDHVIAETQAAKASDEQENKMAYVETDESESDLDEYEPEDDDGSFESELEDEPPSPHLSFSRIQGPVKRLARIHRRSSEAQPKPWTPPYLRMPSPSDAALPKPATNPSTSGPSEVYGRMQHNYTTLGPAYIPPYQSYISYPTYGHSYTWASQPPPPPPGLPSMTEPIHSQRPIEPTPSAKDHLPLWTYGNDISFQSPLGHPSQRAFDESLTSMESSVKVPEAPRPAFDKVQNERLNISNLINETQTATTTTQDPSLLSRKRKAHHVSPDDAEVEPSQATQELLSNHSTQLSDAQRRLQIELLSRSGQSREDISETDGPFSHYEYDQSSPQPLPSVYATDLADTPFSPALSSPFHEPTSPKYTHASPISATTVSNPISNKEKGKVSETKATTARSAITTGPSASPGVTILPTNTVAPMDLPSQANTSQAKEEPPRKKAKTSCSKFGGIAKFMAGAAAGAIGVLATIIATAPDSVVDEAAKEMMGGR